MIRFSEIMKQVNDVEAKLASMVSVISNNFPCNKTYEECGVDKIYFESAASKGYALPSGDTGERIMKSWMASSTQFLAKNAVAKEDEAVALVLEDVNSNFKFAAVVECHNATEADEPGNWSYALILDEDQYKEIKEQRQVTEIFYNDDKYKLVFDKACHDVGGISFNCERYMYDALILIIDTLVGILDGMAKEGEQETIVLEGYFEAAVSIENGEKVFSMTPAGEMKSIINSHIGVEN